MPRDTKLRPGGAETVYGGFGVFQNYLIVVQNKLKWIAWLPYMDNNQADKELEDSGANRILSEYLEHKKLQMKQQS